MHQVLNFLSLYGFHVAMLIALVVAIAGGFDYRKRAARAEKSKRGMRFEVDGHESE